MLNLSTAARLGWEVEIYVVSCFGHESPRDYDSHDLRKCKSDEPYTTRRC